MTRRCVPQTCYKPRRNTESIMKEKEEVSTMSETLWENGILTRISPVQVYFQIKI